MGEEGGGGCPLPLRRGGGDDVLSLLDTPLLLSRLSRERGKNICNGVRISGGEENRRERERESEEKRREKITKKIEKRRQKKEERRRKKRERESDL